jgi:hypothetical protein
MILSAVGGRKQVSIGFYPIDIVQMLSKCPSFAGIIIAEAIARKFTYAKLLTS